MSVLNRLVGAAAAPVFAALSALPPLAQIALLSLVLAVFVLLAFKWTSSPARIGAAKRRMQAGFFEVRLLNHDLRSMLRAQGDILRANAAYVRASALPILCTLPPMLLILAQMQSAYGYSSVRAGDAVLFAIDWTPAAAGSEATRPAVQLEMPPGLHIEAGDVWIPAQRESVWRLRAERAGRYAVRVRVGDAAFSKEVVVGGRGVRVSPKREQPGFVAELLYPVEPPLPATAPIARLRVAYAPAAIAVFGHDTSWMIVSLVLVTAFAWLLKGRFRVVL